jgi:hypothetical protein
MEMKSEEALREWLGDATAQAVTLGGMQGAARAIQTQPEMARLLAAVDEVRAQGAEAVLALARAFLAEPAAIDGAIELMARRAAEDPYYRPHFRLASSEVHAGLLLVDTPALTVMLAAMDADAIASKRARRRGGASIVFSGQRAVYRFLKAGGAILSFWTVPTIAPGFTAADSGRCTFAGRRRIEDGDVVDIDGRSQAFLIDSAPCDLVYLHATTQIEAAPLKVEFDSTSFQFAGASSTDEGSSRIQMMLSLLRTMDRVDAVPLFVELLSTGHFYARWHAMRELLALDAEAALPHLRAMAADDPHHDVRTAARETLSRFFDELATPVEEPGRCRA